MLIVDSKPSRERGPDQLPDREEAAAVRSAPAAGFEMGCFKVSTIQFDLNAVIDTP